MTRGLRVGVILVIGVVAASFAHPSGANAYTLEFSSDFGPMTLEVAADDTVKGSYPKYKGVIAGKVFGKDLLAYWMQPNGEKPCETDLGGTKYWGRVHFPEPDAQSNVAGQWSYCDGEPKAAWRATLLRMK